MATKPMEWKYAQMVNEQYNPNLEEHTRWINMVNAVGDDKRTWAMCYYNKNGSKYTTPTTLTAHNFKLDIPKNAYVKRVMVEISIKVAHDRLQVYAPSAHFMIYGGQKEVTGSSRRVTGWDSNGYYGAYSYEVLSTSEKIISYVIPEEELRKRNYPASRFNENMMGVDFDFPEPLSMEGTNTAVYINWVRFRVDYEMPQTYLRWGSDMRDEYNPYELKLDHTYMIPLQYGNKSKASAGHDQTVDIDLPFGVSLDHYEVADSFGTENRLVTVDDFYGKYRWNVDGGIGAENYIKLYVHTDYTGFQTFSATNAGKTIDGYAYIRGSQREYSSADISSGVIQKTKPSCFHFKTKVNSADNSITYGVVVDGRNQADSSSVSSAFKQLYNNPNGDGNYLIQWTLNQESANQGVSIDWDNTDNDTIKFIVPKNTNVEIAWTGCFMPVTEGVNTLLLIDGDANRTYEYDYNSLASAGVTAEFTLDDTVWYDHRVITSFTTGGIVVPFASKDTDRYMYESDCNMAMNIQEPIAYVGCVPLVHSHHDPQSDFSNKSIKNTYKNKIYTGKTGEIEESISFELHLPPRDWTTLQGLCEMDKPVPVNAVPTAFEGDILNHRGWVELGGVKNVKKTNPLYYHGELDVEYITHNINTRFQISKGLPVSNYTTDTLKELLDYVVESGDEFADYTYTNTDGEIVHNNTGYFIVDTDGNYIYDIDNVPNRRTLMTMDNGQYISIKSVDALSEATKISFEWYSTKIIEDRENNIERIIKLVDGTGATVMEYKYFDYDFDTRSDKYSCRVNCSVLNKSVGSFDTVIDADMYLGNDIESLNLTKDANGNIVQEDEPNSVEFAYNDFMYGSKVHFTLQGNVLSIVDEGFTGREISQGSIQLEKGQYYFDVEFVNHNSDGDTNDVIHFFDFIIQESILSSDYKQLYSDVMVSSFPIPNKTLLYTRFSEEGTLYYYKNDGTAFTYIQEPFYMYFNGVDLKSREGVSLFNLNNSYTIFYLQNGLVRLGFNRLNGQLYLYKYDLQSRSYIQVTTLQLKDYIDFNIGAFSDDKIEVKVGKTIFTMYRGYPYVVIKHSQDDIDFKTIFNRAYAEGVNGVNNNFPVLWDLINSDNLLPSCITGEDIKSSCIDIDTVYNDDVGTEPTLTLTKTSPSTVYNGDTIIFNLTGTVTNVDEQINILEDYTGSFGEYSSEIGIDQSSPYLLTTNSSKNPMQSGQYSEITAKLVDWEYKGINGKRVDFYEIYELSSLKLFFTKNILQTGEHSEITAKLQDEDGSLIKGERVDFYEVYTPTPPVVKATKQIIQANDTTEITAVYRDEDGSAIRNERIDFCKNIDSTGWSMSINSSNDPMQVNDTTDITATVKDSNNNPVEGVYVRFYVEED